MQDFCYSEKPFVVKLLTDVHITESSVFLYIRHLVLSAKYSHE